MAELCSITRESPTWIRLEGFPEGELRRQLTFVNKAVDFDLKRVKGNKRLQKSEPEEWIRQVNELKALRVQTLLVEDDDGFKTYSGLTKFLQDKFRASFVDQLEYPEAKRIPWSRTPDKEPRPYQKTMKELLLEARHGAVEVGTGLGKSFVIMLLAKELALKTVVMTPSISIGDQIYDEFVHHLGQRYVGKFFDGKKESGKLFTIAVDDSLTNIEPGSPHWKNLSKTQVFIADESHLLPAKSLVTVCTGLLENAPYRFFFSGTQLRNDGLDLLLKGLIGPIVFKMTVKEGVDQGWLAKPMFRMVPVNSESKFSSPDTNQMTRAHLYYDPMINAKAAQLANMFVEQGRQVVILVKEVEQIAWLDRAWDVLDSHYDMPRYDVRAAHASDPTAKKKKRSKDAPDPLPLPLRYHESDPKALVKEFNAGKFPILVGTSCITTGTDIQTVGAIIYLQGGKSEIQVKQSVGRGTRKPPGKTDCYFVDFDVQNVDDVHRHADARASIYKSIYPDFEVLPL